MSKITYNDELIAEIKEVIHVWEESEPDKPIVLVKADYLAERSITDNIKSESG